MNETFKVAALDEIAKEHFEKACWAAMTEPEKSLGLLHIPGGDEYLLWSDGGKAKVQVWNWSHMLSLHIVSKNGTWLTSDHLEGMGAAVVIAEAYRRFEAAKPYIELELERSFQEEQHD